MNNKNIILAGAIVIGIYLFSQGKSIFSAAASQTTGQRTAQKVAQKVDISILQVQWLRYMIAHAAAFKITGKEVAVLKAEVARREAAWKAAHKTAPKRVGQPTTRAAYIAAAQKAAARKKIRREAARKIGKIIGKKVAQKVVPRISEETGGRTGMALYIYLKKKAGGMRAARTQAVKAARTGRIPPSSKWAGGRTGMALVIYLKKREIALEQAAKQAKAAITRPASKLFSGAEKSRIIPYSESSKHSYYGPKSHKLQNEGYRVEMNKRQANSIEAYDDSKLQYVSTHPEHWKR